jgi:hypothetical protein
MARRTSNNDIWLGNAVLEAFLVHVRVLDDFLGKRTHHREDVLATGYCPEWGPRSALEEAVRTDVDRRVARCPQRGAGTATGSCTKS